MKAVLVTGATTAVGRALLAQLDADPTVETVLAIGRAAHPAPLGTSPRVIYHVADLTRPRQVHDLLFGRARQLGIDAIVHGPLHEDPSDGPDVDAADVDATLDLLTLAEQLPTIERFVYRSSIAVYRHAAGRPERIHEDHPIALGGDTPAWLQQRIDADLAVSTRMGLTRLSMAVLRFAEIMAPWGGQLADWLSSRVCLRPMGYDPMVNVLTPADAARAIALALASQAQGIFNIPGSDTLPLSELIAHAGRLAVPMPGPLLAPLYALRSRLTRGRFLYPANRDRFHFTGVLDGARAHIQLGYQPAIPLVR